MKNCSFFLVAYITFVFLSTAAVLCWTTFDVTELNACPPQDSKFLTLVERSLEQCVEECTRRKSCAVVGYKRVLRLCELHMHSSMPVVSDNHCIRIMRDDIHGPKQDSCGEWQVFETTAGIEHCTVKECKPQPPLINGQFLGNKNEVGSKKAVKCKYGYIEENNTKSVECLKEGIWSHNVSCVLKDCGAVSPIIKGTLTLDIPGQTTYQSTASVNCSVGYETVNKTVTCLATGTWSASECVIKCPNNTGIIELKEDFRLKIYTDNKNRWEAADTCSSELNGQLVVLDKKWKMNAVSNILISCSDYKENDDYWTDGNCWWQCRLTDGNCWSWQCSFTNGESMLMTEQTFWHTGKPNGQLCVLVQNKKGVYMWNDKSCSKQYRYICEY